MLAFRTLFLGRLQAQVVVLQQELLQATSKAEEQKYRLQRGRFGVVDDIVAAAGARLEVAAAEHQEAALAALQARQAAELSELRDAVLDTVVATSGEEVAAQLAARWQELATGATARGGSSAGGQHLENRNLTDSPTQMPEAELV